MTERNVVISMTLNQLTLQAVRRAGRTLKHIHDEQMLMWEGVWRTNRFPEDRTGGTGTAS